MNRLIVAMAAVLFGLHDAAAWSWPFGEDEKKKPPRVSELMEPASVLIDEASDLAAEGKVQESVEKYRKALEELDRVERENPDRVGKPEFATVRNKRAYVNAAIDSMLMTQVQENAKAVAVSDTTELERKLEAERAVKSGGKVPPEKPRTAAGAEAGPDGTAEKPASAGKKPPAKRSAPGKTRNDLIIADIAAGEFDAAAISIGEMLEEKPNSAAALNLQAAMEAAQGKFREAEKTLDRAIMSNPRSHYAYYNMARLILQTRPDGRSTARRYYETGRAVGGPADAELEGLVK